MAVLMMRCRGTVGYKQLAPGGLGIKVRLNGFEMGCHPIASSSPFEILGSRRIKSFSRVCHKRRCFFIEDVEAPLAMSRLDYRHSSIKVT